MATTMKDVARRAGVDISTVSLAINNDPRIRAETRERILHIAQELGYRKNHLARGLRSGKSLTVGAVVSHATTFWGEFLAGAQSVLSGHDYHLLLDYAPDSGRREEVQIEALKAKRVDGLLVAPSDTELAEDPERVVPQYQALIAERVPFVFIDRVVPGLEADTVAADNASAGREATRHLLSLGHKRIAYLYAPHRMNTAQRDRIEAYQAAMREADLTPLLWECVREFPERSQEGLEATRELLASPESKGLTALLCSTDSTAMGALRALYEAGRRVPAEIAVMGIGGMPAARYLEPPLTTMSLPMRELGARGAELLLARIGGDASPVQRVVLPAELIVRGSCGGTVPRT